MTAPAEPSKMAEMDNPQVQEERGWVNGRAFLISGFLVFLVICLVAFVWTSTGATVDVPRDWWGTPTPTPRQGALPF